MSFLDDIEKVAGSLVGDAATSANPASPAVPQPGLPGALAGMAGAAGANPALVQEAMRLLTDNSSGGLAGLAQQFEQQGLGHLVGSWMGQGPNLPVSGAQLQGVLGNQRMQELAQRVGLPPDAAASALASVLPSLVDRVTPNGTLEHTLLQDGLSWLQGRLA